MRYSAFQLLKHHRYTPIFFALFTEFLILATLGFMFLLSLETLLPTFVSARINLALYCGALLALFIYHYAFAVWSSQKIQAPRGLFLWFLKIFLILWITTLLALSLLEFPLLASIVIFLLCGLLGYLFHKTYPVV